MKDYRIVIWNNTQKDKEEVLLMVEMKRSRLTKREFDMVKNELFDLAAISCDYRSLSAEIYCNDEEVLTIRCNTLTDGSQVLSTINIGDKYIRTATLAA